jgi:hypothetical protein
MAARKKQTQTFHYCNYDNKKKMSPSQPPIELMTTQKKQIAIAFLLSSM